MTAVVPAAVRHNELVSHDLRAMVELAVALIDGCDRAAVVVADDDGGLVSVADLGALDVEAEPVLDAVRTGRSQCIDEPTAWMAVPLFLGRVAVGVFAMSGPAGIFTDRRAQRLGAEVAEHAALALAAACLMATTAELSAVLAEARDVVDQAHGVIMARSRCGPEAAAAQLASDAVREGQTLDEMAASVIASTQPA